MTDRDDVRIRPFADFLRDHNKGASHDELSETLHTLVARVIDTGKKGTVTYTLAVEPLKGAAEGVYTVKDEIKVRLPEFDRNAGIFFVDRDGNLVREDPNQLAFESLRVAAPRPTVQADDPPHDPATGVVTDTSSTA